MEAMTPPFIIGVILVCLLSSLAVWAPRRIWVRCWAIGLSGIIFVCGYVALADMLSRPKPMSLAWAESSVASADVLGSSYIEGEAIFVWLRLPGSLEPRAYKLPWNDQQAQQLQDATKEAGENGTGVQMRQPFDRSEDTDEPLFYALPQPPSPEKNYSSGEAPIIYERPDPSSSSL